MSDELLKPHSIVRGKHSTKVVFETSTDALAEKVDKLDTFLRELCPNPREAMVICFSWLKAAETLEGCRIEQTENPPQ
jgi:hypothetical protein